MILDLLTRCLRQSGVHLTDDVRFGQNVMITVRFNLTIDL